MKDIDDLEDSFQVIFNAILDGENSAPRIGQAFLDGLATLIKPYSSRRKRGYELNELVVFKKTIYQATGKVLQGQSPDTFPSLWASNFATSLGQVTETGENYQVGTRLLAEYFKSEIAKLNLSVSVPDIDMVGEAGKSTDRVFDFGNIRYKSLNKVANTNTFLSVITDADGKLSTVQVSLSDLKKILGIGQVVEPPKKIPKYKILSLERAVADISETVPSAPTDLKIVEYEEGKYKFTLVDTSNNEAGFEIEASVNGAQYVVYKKLGANATDSGPLADFDPTKNWILRARAYNKKGYSLYSDSAVYVAPLPTYPALPKPPVLPDITTYVGDKVSKQFADFEYSKPADLVREMLNLPTGLTWDAVTRTVIGTSPMTDSRDVIYKATDKFAGIGQKTYRWTVLRKGITITQVEVMVYDKPQFADYALLMYIQTSEPDTLEFKFDNLPDRDYGTPIKPDAVEKQWHEGRVPTSNSDLIGASYYWSYYKESRFPENAPPAGFIVRWYVRPKSNPSAVQGPFEIPIGGSIVFPKTIVKPL